MSRYFSWKRFLWKNGCTRAFTKFYCIMIMRGSITSLTLVDFLNARDITTVPYCIIQIWLLATSDCFIKLILGQKLNDKVIKVCKNGKKKCIRIEGILRKKAYVYHYFVNSSLIFYYINYFYWPLLIFCSENDSLIIFKFVS